MRGGACVPSAPLFPRGRPRPRKENTPPGLDSFICTTRKGGPCALRRRSTIPATSRSASGCLTSPRCGRSAFGQATSSARPTDQPRLHDRRRPLPRGSPARYALGPSGPQRCASGPSATNLPRQRSSVCARRSFSPVRTPDCCGPASLNSRPRSVRRARGCVANSTPSMPRSIGSSKRSALPPENLTHSDALPALRLSSGSGSPKIS